MTEQMGSSQFGWGQAPTNPPEPRMCPGNEHEADGSTFRVSQDDLPNMVALVDCEKGGATADVQPQTSDFKEWEL